MTELLIRLCVKHKDDVKDLGVRQQYGIMASITGIMVNVLVCLGELIVGWFIGSIAMISDAIHNVADAGGSLVSFLSFKLSGRKADAEHPYGHGRMEYLLSIGFSILLFVVAAQLGIEAVDHIMNPEIVEFSMSALAVMLGAMVLKFGYLSFYVPLGIALILLSCVLTGKKLYLMYGLRQPLLSAYCWAVYSN